jgi:hypothetical protein
LSQYVSFSGKARIMEVNGKDIKDVIHLHKSL